MAANRSILSLPLSKDVIAALSSAGYAKLGDIAGSTPEGLAQGLFPTPCAWCR
jgi:hypothetical protein